MNSSLPRFTLHLTCSLGLEQLLATEASNLGAEDPRPRLGRVSCQATLATAYRLVLWSRLASRVLLQLDQAKIENASQLNAWLSQIAWQDHLAPQGSLFVEVHGTTPALRNTHDTALRVKDAVVDYFMQRDNCRPSVEKHRPDVRLHLRMEKFQRAVLSLDLGGVSLHQRGYRLETGLAPLRENLAAALLLRADWPALAKAGAALYDPFCGSGTLLAEAALMALDIAPGLLRPWQGLTSWLGHQEDLWQQLLEEATQRQAAGAALDINISGSDQDPKAIQAATNNLKRAGVLHRVKLAVHPVSALPAASTTNGLIITNPPYGERLENLPRLASLYGEFGALVAAKYPGWKLALFTNNQELAFRIPLKAFKSYPLNNAALDCRLYLFQVPATAHLSADKSAATDAPSSHQTTEASSSANTAQAGLQLSAGAQMLANRLSKNQRHLARWVNKENISCYRLYDADMPEYAFALDIYADQVHLQEYAPPATVNANQAQKRLMEALQAIPQALNIAPEKIHLKTRRRQTGKNQYEKHTAKGEFFEVSEGQVKLWVNLSAYLDTGLFLDHRPVRLRIGQAAAGKRFLNLFCYTGVATLHAAVGGALHTTSVDLSKTYLDWLEKNLRLNRLDLKRHSRIQADCKEWLRQDKGAYDLIFMDPPTFSNSKQMRGTLDIQRDHAELIHLAMQRLTSQGLLIFSTNLRGFKLDQALHTKFEIKDITRSTLDQDFQRNSKIHQCYEIRHPLAN